MLRLRAASTIVLVPILTGLLFVGGLVWAVVIAISAILATREYYCLMGGKGISASRVVGLIWSAGLVLIAYQPTWPRYIGVMAGGVALSLLLVAIEDDGDPMLSWAILVCGVVLVGGLLSALVSLRQLPDGRWWTVLPLAAVWTGDAGAYLIGSALGRRPILPRVSPGKTWAGTISGFVLSLLGVLVCVAAFHRWLPGSSVGQIGWGGSVVVGLMIGPLALAGDLAISMIKRRAEVKDSSNLIPGHGGMLDRADSLLFTVPLVYLWATLVM